MMGSKKGTMLAPSLPDLQSKRSVVVATALLFSDRLFATGKIYSAISGLREKTASWLQLNYIPSIEWPTAAPNLSCVSIYCITGNEGNGNPGGSTRFLSLTVGFEPG
jgi:hypothetical protein